MGKNILNIDTELVGYTPLFLGTQVHEKKSLTIFKPGEPIDYFIDNFDVIKREDVIRVHEILKKNYRKLLNSTNEILLY